MSGIFKIHAPQYWDRGFCVVPRRLTPASPQARSLTPIHPEKNETRGCISLLQKFERRRVASPFG
jgi:hypothetical protein